MKKEHFHYIIDRFNLMDLSATNDMFRPETIDNLRIVSNPYHSQISIRGSHDNFIFVRLPSESFAQEIIDHIRETEVLFI